MVGLPHVCAAELARMKIGIVTPAPPDSRHGNRITALRWATILRRLGNHVSISQTYDGRPYDLLVALHALKSHSWIINFRQQHLVAPIIVALTGTDLYRDIRVNHLARESLDIATRIVVLQPKAVKELRPSWRKKTRVIFQSVKDRHALNGTSGGAAEGKGQAGTGKRSKCKLDVAV